MFASSVYLVFHVEKSSFTIDLLLGAENCPWAVYAGELVTPRFPHFRTINREIWPEGTGVILTERTHIYGFGDTA